MSALIFRNANAADWDSIAQLLQHAQLPLDGAQAHLANFIVAERGNELAGCAGLECYNATGLLRSVAVKEAERGRGVGRELTQRILIQARREGIHTIVLLTETAQEFFPQFGFRAISRTEVPPAVLASAEFQANCCTSAGVMRLEL